jgi:hypothetical protein
VGMGVTGRLRRRRRMGGRMAGDRLAPLFKGLCFCLHFIGFGFGIYMDVT